MTLTRLPGLVAIAILAMATGCQSSHSTDLQAAIDHYDSGSLTLAKIESQRIYEQGGTEAPEAAWLIGLCDYRLGRQVAARSAFALATDSPDPVLAARARAMIGQSYMDDDQPAAAAIQFEHAWPHLSGEDRRKCAEHAASAWARAGRADMVAMWSKRADEPVETTTVVTTSSTSIQTEDPGAFTIQVGAFKKQDGARQASRELNRMANGTSLGASTIRTRTDRHGSTLYLVQIGSFDSRHAARNAARDLTQREVMIVTVGSTTGG